MMSPHLLIDGRNILYRAVFANYRSASQSNDLVVMLRLLGSTLSRLSPGDITVAWDAKRSSVWRKQILPDYKDRGEQASDITERLINGERLAKDLFTGLGVRQLFKESMEADDLIYAASRVLYPQPTVILSSDKDYLQIPYRMSNVRLFDPCGKKFLEPGNVDPVTLKVLSGDKSDNISGYKGIGPVKGAKLAENIVDRNKFLRTNGTGRYNLNLLLVDLSLCPHLQKNVVYSEFMLSQSGTFDKNYIISFAKDNNIGEIMSEFENIILPFKFVCNGE